MVGVETLSLGQVLPRPEGEGVADCGSGALGGVAAEAAATYKDVRGDRQELVVGGELFGDGRDRVFVAEELVDHPPAAVVVGVHLVEGLGQALFRVLDLLPAADV